MLQCSSASLHNHNSTPTALITVTIADADNWLQGMLLHWLHAAAVLKDPGKLKCYCSSNCIHCSSTTLSWERTRYVQFHWHAMHA